MWFDVSLDIDPKMPHWPGHDATSITRFSDVDCGDSSTCSLLKMSVHAGTHVDAPIHWFKEGSGVEALSLEALIGDAFVLNVKGDGAVEGFHIDQIPAGVDRVIFKTRNSAHWEKTSFEFDPTYVALTQDASQAIVRRKFKLVGIDGLSIQRYKERESMVHDTLFNHNVVIVEGLDLRKAETGHYEFICAPLKIKGGDGAPARVFLKKKS